MVNERSEGGGGGGGNVTESIMSVHHVCVVALLSVCRSVNVLLCVNVIQSLRMFYVLLFLTSLVYTECRRRREVISLTNGLSQIPSRK